MYHIKYVIKQNYKILIIFVNIIGIIIHVMKINN